MNNRNLLIGIGMGMAMGSLGAMMLRPKKSQKMKSAVLGVLQEQVAYG